MLLLSGIVMLTVATASMGNTAPVADAGPDQVISTKFNVRLDGTASYDMDRDKLAYRWTFTRKPAGSVAEFTEAKEKKTRFTADIGGSYVIQLIVNDGTVDSDPDSLSVYVGPDTTLPMITLNGANPMDIVVGGSYIEAGASVTDDKDGSVMVTITGNVDTSVVGTYTITYTATDIAGNTAIKTRTVNIVLPPDTTPPVITLNGDFTVILTQGDSYTEAGVTATDDRDGSVTVTTSGTVDMATVGTYTITYSATDSAGNIAGKSRSVYVIMLPEQVEILPYDVNKIEGYESSMDLSMVAGSIKNQYWIRAYNRLTETELLQIVSEYTELSVVGYSDIHGLLVEIPEDNYEAMVALKTIELKKGITSVRQRVYMGSGLRKENSVIPDDGGSPFGDTEGDNWHLDYINMPEAWEITTGDENIFIGIADSGFYVDHEDIANNRVRLRTNIKGSHGTAVAGTIAADTNNSKGISGINWKSKLVLYDNKLITDTDDPSPDTYDIIFKNIFEVDEILDPKVKLVNNSWGDGYWVRENSDGEQYQPERNVVQGIKYTRDLKEVIQYYKKKLFIFAAMNEFLDARVSNGALHLNDDGARNKEENLIIVAALLKDGNLPAYSNYGSTVDIAAPTSFKAPKAVKDGESTYLAISNPALYGTDHNLIYYDRSPIIFQGTSAAAPVVTGVASLIYSLNPDFTPQGVKNILIKSSSRFAKKRYVTPGYISGETPIDLPLGNEIPILDAGAALQMAQDIVDGKVVKVTHYYPSAFFLKGTAYVSSANRKLKLENASYIVEGQNEDSTWENLGFSLLVNAEKGISFDTDPKYKKYRISGNANFESFSTVGFSEEFENNIRKTAVSIIDNATGEGIEGAKITIEITDTNYLSELDQLIFQNKTLVDSSEVDIYLEKNKAYKIHVTKDGYYKDYIQQLNIVDGDNNLTIRMAPLDAEASGAVHGKVVDSDDNGIINARVVLSVDGKIVQALTTEQNGQYIIWDIDILDDNEDYILHDLNISKAGYISAGIESVGLLDGKAVQKNFTLEKIEGYVNTPPVADAGTDITATFGETVELNASASSDLDGPILKYVWTEGSESLGEGMILPLDDLSIGTHTVTLTVTDENEAIATDEVKVIITDAPPVASTKVKKTGQTISYTDFDDGYYQKGVTPSYTRDDVNEIVTDNVTGLEWQDTPEAETTQLAWQDSVDYCTALPLDGGGWRLPSIEELDTLVDVGRYDPSATEGIFNHIFFSSYWSSTTYAYNTDLAWFVFFRYGGSTRNTKMNSYYVRCVRGEPLVIAHNFERNNTTEIVNDSSTGLQWQDDANAISITSSWLDAIDYCEHMLTLGGHTDWRLPNHKELLSIADRSRYNSAIDDTVFLNTASYNHWSSTGKFDGTDNAWIVNFNYGNSGTNYKEDSNYMRCVRDGQ